MYGYITDNNTVGQLFDAMPPDDMYHSDFLDRIMPLPEGVTSGWAYDPDTGVFAPIGSSLDEAKADKLQELSTACNATITAGCGVTLSDGTTGHISMTEEDQINLLAALSAVQTGQAGYPYHLDGDLCRVYPAADIVIMATAATQHKLYHTTYCNHLNVWVRRCETVEDVQAITYGVELPGDLAANLAEVLGHVG